MMHPGRRIFANEKGGLTFSQPGDYGCLDLVSFKLWYARLPTWDDQHYLGEGEWVRQVCIGVSGTIPGLHADLARVEEHQDGTITVKKTILWDGSNSQYPGTWWIGKLDHGQWKDA